MLVKNKKKNVASNTSFDDEKLDKKRVRELEAIFNIKFNKSLVI